MPFKQDPYVKPLADGSGLGACWGLAVAVDEALIDEKWYKGLCEELRKAHPAFRGEDEVAEAYLYKYHALHVTVASPWPFTVETWRELSKEQLDEMVERWRKIVTGATSVVEAKGGEAGLLLNKVQLSSAAGIFRFDDVDGAVTKVRDEILSRFIEAGAAREKEGGKERQGQGEGGREKTEKGGGSAEASAAAGAGAAAAAAATSPSSKVIESTAFKMPSRNFVHTSFLRWLRVDAEKATEEWERGVASAFEGAVKSHLAKWQGAAKAWPMPCSFSRVNLFREDGGCGVWSVEEVEE